MANPGSSRDPRFVTNKICTNCGERLMAAALRCPKCGQQQPKPSTMEAKPEETKAGVGTLLKGVAAVFVVVLIAGLVFTSSKDHEPTNDRILSTPNTNNSQSGYSQDVQQGFSRTPMSMSRAELADTALGIRSAGYTCNQATDVDRVYENGRELPFFVVTCDDVRDYQVSILNERIFVKPWTGSLLGN